MKKNHKLMKIICLSFLGGLLFACGSGNEVIVPAESFTEPTPAPIPEPALEPTPALMPEPVPDIQVLFTEDIIEDIRQSTPTDISLPLGLQATFDIEYLGAFRVLADGESSSDYAVGTLGFNPDNNSIYMAGHSQDDAIAEFEIPSQLSFETNPSNIPRAPVLQEYVSILNKKEVGNDTNMINGILYHDQSLLVSSEIWYDGTGNNNDNLQVFSNAHDIRTSVFKGMLQVEGEAKAAGYISKVPAELREKVGTEYLIGWASNYSITSRYSQGPSLYRFKPEDAIDAVLSIDRGIDTTPLMVFPLAEGKQLVEGGQGYNLDISPIWGPVTQVRHGFIIPDTEYFLAIGSHSGLHSGIGYKITQDNGNSCDGPCPYASDDEYNYFWVFDVNEILDAEEPWLARPISYGKWSHPYDNHGGNKIIGATFDDQNHILYLSLSSAAKIGRYDNPPLIISYQVQAKQ